MICFDFTVDKTYNVRRSLYFYPKIFNFKQNKIESSYRYARCPLKVFYTVQQRISRKIFLPFAQDLENVCMFPKAEYSKCSCFVSDVKYQFTVRLTRLGLKVGQHGIYQSVLEWKVTQFKDKLREGNIAAFSWFLCEILIG